MSKWRWAVACLGWEDSCGGGWSWGDGESAPRHGLMGVYATRAEAEAALEDLEEKAEDNLPALWIPGNPHWKPIYELRAWDPWDYVEGNLYFLSTAEAARTTIERIPVGRDRAKVDGCSCPGHSWSSS